MNKTYIRVRTEFEGFHFYPGASKINPKIAFLEKEHRHMFKVEIKISVTHLDRELEFFLVKWALQDFIKSGNQNHKSCEMMADDLHGQISSKYTDRKIWIEVSEDGENGCLKQYA